jgi:hypothetical protein
MSNYLSNKSNYVNIDNTNYYNIINNNYSMNSNNLYKINTFQNKCGICTNCGYCK